MFGDIDMLTGGNDIEISYEYITNSKLISLIPNWYH